MRIHDHCMDPRPDLFGIIYPKGVNLAMLLRHNCVKWSAEAYSLTS